MSVVIAREPIVIGDFAQHIVDVASRNDLLFKVDVAFDPTAHGEIGEFALRVRVGSLESLYAEPEAELPTVLKDQPHATEYDGRWNWALLGLDRADAEDIAAAFCREQMAIHRNAAIALFSEPHR